MLEEKKIAIALLAALIVAAIMLSTISAHAIETGGFRKDVNIIKKEKIENSKVF